MNAHIRLVSSETVAEDANNHDAHENAEGRDEAPIGLPEEGGSNRNDILGDAPPPLVAEPEDRAGGARNAKRGSKKGVAKLIALIWPPKPKAPAPVEGEENERRGRSEGRASGRRRRRPALRRRRKALAARRKRQNRRPSRGAIVLSSTTVRLGTAPRSRPPPKQSVRS